MLRNQLFFLFWLLFAPFARSRAKAVQSGTTTERSSKWKKIARCFASLPTVSGAKGFEPGRAVEQRHVERPRKNWARVALKRAKISVGV